MKSFAALLIVLLLSACGRNDCLSEAQAIQLLAEGAELEAQEQPQAARQKYKSIDLYACDLSKPSTSEAFDRSMRIHKQVELAYEQTQAALADYLAQHKRLPDSLSEIEGAIPAESRGALRGFVYFRKSDTTYDIALGLIGAANFDLSSRSR